MSGLRILRPRSRPGGASCRGVALSLLRGIAATAAAAPAVGHLLEGTLAAGRLEQRFRKLLLLLDHGLEKVAELLDPFQHLVRIEDEQFRILCLEALLDLVP